MRYVVPLGLVVGLAASCWRPDYNHCGSNEGDASCPDGMFCDACEPENNGCTVELPSTLCHVEGDLVAGESSGSTAGDDASASGSMGSTAGEETGEATQGTTTSSTECESDVDCTSPDAPFCDATGLCVGCDGLSDPDGACQAQDPARPVCAAGACVQCSAEQAEACDGETPVCSPDNTCTACTEHAQCPQSACHLDGLDVGSCFDLVDVTMVGNTMELSTALAALGPNDQAVFVLETGDYEVTVEIGGNAEVALIGSGMVSPILEGDGAQSVEVFGNALVYMDNVDISNSDIFGAGLSCSGLAVWLDDSRIRGNAQLGMDISGGCATHLRRTGVRTNSGGGVSVDGLGTHLYAENSVIADNVGPAAAAGIRVVAASVELTFSVVVSNGTFAAPVNFECLGDVFGEVRNSIVSGPVGDSIVDCGAMSWNTNALDTGGLGATNKNIGPYSGTWFVEPGTGDYHLSAGDLTTFMDVAMWQSDDPLTDVDGDPIPTEAASFPGYDQP